MGNSESNHFGAQGTLKGTLQPLSKRYKQIRLCSCACSTSTYSPLICIPPQVGASLNFRILRRHVTDHCPPPSVFLPLWTSTSLVYCYFYDDLKPIRVVSPCRGIGPPSSGIVLGTLFLLAADLRLHPTWEYPSPLYCLIFVDPYSPADGSLAQFWNSSDARRRDRLLLAHRSVRRRVCRVAHAHAGSLRRHTPPHPVSHVYMYMYI